MHAGNAGYDGKASHHITNVRHASQVAPTRHEILKNYSTHAIH